MWLLFSRRVLLFVLMKITEAQVSFPTETEILEYVAAISAKYPILTNIWGAVDGIKMLLQESGDFIIQNMYYNGWTHSHYISSIYMFAPDGHIRICSLNSPGCWHDSHQSEYDVYATFKKVFDLYKAEAVVNLAFWSRGEAPYLIKSLHADYVGSMHSLLIGQAATSV